MVTMPQSLVNTIGKLYFLLGNTSRLESGKAPKMRLLQFLARNLLTIERFVAIS